MNTKEQIQAQCYELALHGYATSYIYSLRQAVKSKLIKAITLMGFVVPVLIGGVVTSYGLDSFISNVALIVLTPVALAQLVMSSVSLIYRWDEQANYYLESYIANRVLSEEFEKLAKYPMEDIQVYRHSFEILFERNRGREEQDDKYQFNDEENRRGMRYSLRRYQRKCVACELVPTDMVSTDCGVCGRFK